MNIVKLGSNASIKNNTFLNSTTKNNKTQNNVTIYQTNTIDALSFMGKMNIGLVKHNDMNFPANLKEFLRTNDNELFNQTIKNVDLSKYKNTGLPLKYSREELLESLCDVLYNFNADDKNQILNYFNLKFDVVYDNRISAYTAEINGIPNLDADVSNMPQIYKTISYNLNHYCKDNEVQTNNPQENYVFNTIIKTLPEFTMIIGKKQHDAHDSTLDIHSLKVLQKIMQNDNYNKLTDGAKGVLKLTALIHDFGKDGYCIDNRHPEKSAEISKRLCNKYGLNGQCTNYLVYHHNWFSEFNQNRSSAIEVAEKFGNNPEFIKCAKIFAKADFESINSNFHLQKLEPDEYLTQAEFDELYTEIVDKIPESKIDYILVKTNISTRIPIGRLYPNGKMNDVLTKEQRDIYRSSYSAYERTRNIRYSFDDITNIFTTNDLLHGTSIKSLEKILDSNGILPREITGNDCGAVINGQKVDTLTPLCVDTWEIDTPRTIERFFNPESSHWITNKGENSFLPKNNKSGSSSVVICFDKRKIDKTIIDNSFLVAERKSPLYKNGCMDGHIEYKTHRAIPIGIPANAISKIIVNTKVVNQNDIANLKAKIKSNNYDIKIYDLNGILI